MLKKMVQYVYLLQEREFIKTNEKIYKIGKTKQQNHNRFTKYPKDSLLLFQMSCDNCTLIENTILSIFKNNFIQRSDIGNEYFEGDSKNMIEIISYVVNNQDILTTNRTLFFEKIFNFNKNTVVEDVKPIEKVKKVKEVKPVKEIKKAKEVEPVEKVKRVKKVKPVEQIEKVKPVEEIEKVKPIEEIEKVKPIEEIEKVKPVEEIEKVKPVEEIEKVKEVEYIPQIEKNNYPYLVFHKPNLKVPEYKDFLKIHGIP